MRRGRSEEEKLAQSGRHSKTVVAIAIENLFSASIPSSDSTSTPSDKATCTRPNPSEDSNRTPRGSQKHGHSNVSRPRSDAIHRWICAQTHTNVLHCSEGRGQHTTCLHISNKRVVQFLVPLEHWVIVDLRQRDSS